MAKQAVSGVERHVDKIVFVLTGVVLIAAVVQFLLKSPRTVDVGVYGSKGPNEVDAAVLEVAQKLEDRINSAEHKPFQIENPVDRLVAYYRNPLGNYRPILNSALPWRQPTVPQVIGSSGPSKVELASVVAPENLATAKGRSTIHPFVPVPLDADPKENSDLEEDLIWVAVAGEFDLAKQLASFKANAYLSKRSQVWITRVLLQRRPLRGDGSWGDWEPVETYSPYLSAQLPEIRLSEKEEAQPISDEDISALNAFSELITKNQGRIMHPLPPTKRKGDEWRLPSLKNVDVEGTLAVARKNVSGPKVDQAEKEKVQPLEVTGPRDVARVMKQLNELADAREHEEAIRLANIYLDRAERLDRRMVGVITRRLKEFVEKQKQAIEKGVDDKAGGVKSEDRLALWAFDTSAVSGVVYQYRMAVEIQNRYAGVPDLLADPHDAQKPALVGQWSEPSLPVRVPETTRFFLARVSGNQASVEVWKWKLGRWRDERFSVEVGERIGEIKKVKDMQVDFTTNALVVSIEENRAVRHTPIKRATQSARSPEVIESAVLVYQDAGGHLGERVAAIDARDDWRKARKKEGRPRRSR